MMLGIQPNSVHMVLTDPPYFLDGLDTGWTKGKTGSSRATGTVGTLPVGMKFDKRQGEELQQFMNSVATQWLHVLVPGSFALVFSQPRLAHRMAVGIEDAGFEIRDVVAWNFNRQSQFKAFSQDHFVRRMNISEEQKTELIESLGGRKTPQLRPQHESIILAQKPRDGTFVDNWIKWRVGLMNSSYLVQGKSPSNVMSVEKPGKDERNAAGGHLTPKPVELLCHLIELFSTPGQIVLDPFLGSGSTAVAAAMSKRSCIGIEIQSEYVKIAQKRTKEIK